MTTIESSIKIPMASERPSKVSEFSVKPNAAIGRNVEMTQTGMAMATMMVARKLCRNR